MMMSLDSCPKCIVAPRGANPRFDLQRSAGRLDADLVVGGLLTARDRDLLMMRRHTMNTRLLPSSAGRRRRRARSSSTLSVATRPSADDGRVTPRPRVRAKRRQWRNNWQTRSDVSTSG